MLWNAKMRFGKTLSTLQVVRKSEFKRTIIVTHRPVVDSSWYEDFGKIFYDRDDYVYGSKNSGYTVDQLIKTNKKFVYFFTKMQIFLMYKLIEIYKQYTIYIKKIDT